MGRSAGNSSEKRRTRAPLSHIVTQTNPLQAAESFLKKLIFAQIVKKFPAFYGTKRFITAFTKAQR
jgi:hypothetical protein